MAQVFGKHNPPEMTFGYGVAESVTMIPSTYSGMFTAKFYDSNGKQIKYVKTYFEQFAIMRGEYYNTYTTQIESLLNDYCLTHIEPNCKNEEFNTYEHGFEDSSNYVVCFTTAKPVTKSPPTLLETKDEKFTIVWEYSEIEPIYPEEETYDY